MQSAAAPSTHKSGSGKGHLLEKFMDVADLADETATKLIFKGSLGALFPDKNAGHDKDQAQGQGDQTPGDNAS